VRCQIRQHVEQDAVLFLWCTEPMRFAAHAVIEAWGFEHKSAIVWDKVLHNFGHYVSVRHEHLLICTRGSCTPDRPTPMPDSVMTIRRSDVHSEKPREFRAVIEQLYDGPYVELFGRHEVAGWTVFGNQWLTAPASEASTAINLVVS
jgi:N6-adenosine-specific RNA methylase IME4